MPLRAGGGGASGCHPCGNAAQRIFFRLQGCVRLCSGKLRIPAAWHMSAGLSMPFVAVMASGHQLLHRPFAAVHSTLQLLRGGAILQLDSWRVARTGAPEVVWGPGKSPEQIAAIMTSMAETEATVLATRIPQEVRYTLSCSSRALHRLWAVHVCCPHQAARCVAAPL